MMNYSGNSSAMTITGRQSNACAMPVKQHEGTMKSGTRVEQGWILFNKCGTMLFGVQSLLGRFQNAFS